MIQAREPLADDVTGFMGDVSFLVECTSKRVEQNAFYYGYNCNTIMCPHMAPMVRSCLWQLTFPEVELLVVRQHGFCIK